MLISCASEQVWTDAELRHQIRRLHTLRYLFRKPEPGGIVVVWHPWYLCAVEVRMDTALQRGQVHADRVAVDAVRPLRQRLDRIPESSLREIDDQTTVPIRLREEDAKEEARDLLTSVVINRNKLLLSHDITVNEAELVYFRTIIVPVDGLPRGDWPVIEEFFGNTTRLSRRRELEPILQTYPSIPV